MHIEYWYHFQTIHEVGEEKEHSYVLSRRSLYHISLGIDCLAVVSCTEGVNPHRTRKDKMAYTLKCS